MWDCGYNSVGLTKHSYFVLGITLIFTQSLNYTGSGLDSNWWMVDVYIYICFIYRSRKKIATSKGGCHYAEQTKQTNQRDRRTFRRITEGLEHHEWQLKWMFENNFHDEENPLQNICTCQEHSQWGRCIIGV